MNDKVKVKPLSADRAVELSTRAVTAPLSKKRFKSAWNVVDVESESAFGTGKTGDEDLRISNEMYVKRGRIDLIFPVVNFFLTDIDCGTFKTLLGSGVCGASIEDIANGEVIFSVSQQKEYRRKSFNGANGANEEYNASDMLIGGEYILYLLEKLQPLKVAKGTIETLINRKLTPDAEFRVVECVYGSGEQWVYDDFYINVLEPAFTMEASRVIQAMRDSIYKMDDNDSKLEHAALTKKIPYLLTAHKNMESVRNLVMSEMMVLPIGYRQPMDKRRDPLTVAYNKVVGVNKHISDLLASGSVRCSELISQYSDLVRAIKNVTVKKDPTAPQQYKTLLDILKGKRGLIRNNMQGVRSDFTARSVIIVDPLMSIKNIGIPKAMLADLLQCDIIKSYNSHWNNKNQILTRDMKSTRDEMALNMALKGDLFLAFGRQPTLFSLGLQAFVVVPVDGNAIRLNPLCVVAFNADFDGDQGHVISPQSDQAKLEVKTLMANTNNMLFPRNGESHIAPRHEMIYGLWLCSTVKPNEKSKTHVLEHNHENMRYVISKVISHEMQISDRVIFGGVEMTAGVCAIRGCMRKNLWNYRLGVLPLTEDATVEDKPVTESFFKALIKLTVGTNECINLVDDLVMLGFGVAEIHPPNISVTKAPDLISMFKEFDKVIAEREELYYIGMETQESFSLFYDKEYADLYKRVEKETMAFLGTENGFVQMKLSGARGNSSNIMQVFGMKGRIMKSANEAFNTIIPTSLSNVLSGLEHFISAYGAREGVIEKVIDTAGPGYMARKMSHVASHTKITTDDCGTTKGLLIAFDTLKQFMPDYELLKDDVVNNKTIRKKFVNIILGRYIVGFSAPITREEDALHFYDLYVAHVDKETGELVKGHGIEIRSPITCECPVCQKCYGINLATNKIAVHSTPIGFLAAQSIGEPGTQLTMKNFQKGGVVGAKNLTSSFSTMSKHLHITDIGGKTKMDVITHDYISPVEGFIKPIEKEDGTKRLRIMQKTTKGWKNILRTTVILPGDAALKDYVEVGDTIYKTAGDLSLREIINIRSVDEAEIYMAFYLYFLFAKEIEVNLKHFEVMAQAMTLYYCTKSNDTFKSGNYYNGNEYYANKRSGAEFTKVFRGIKDVPLLKHDFFGAMFMENIKKAVARSIMTTDGDTLQNPLVRIAFGLSLGMGSDDPMYIRR